MGEASGGEMSHGTAEARLRTATMVDDIANDTGSAGSEVDAADPEQIRANIEQTRTEMSDTINAIQEKLDPGHLVEKVKDQVRDQVHEQVEAVKDTVREATVGRAEHMIHSASETIGQVTAPAVDTMGRVANTVGDTARSAGSTVRATGSSLVDTIRENPIPAAMAAIGIGWLIMQRSGAGSAMARPVQNVQNTVSDSVAQAADTMSDFADQARDQVSDIAGQARDQVSDIAGHARDMVGGITEQARDRVGDMSGQVQQGAGAAQDWFQHTLQESPLAMGAVAMALGTALGLSLPETPREAQLMGPARDNLVHQAQSVAQDTVQKVQHVATDAAQAAKEAAKSSAQEQGLPVGSGS
jgi:ElaB/YqjD/DUF883 family membrane-anchored ribosome-binding protein